jgi:hypothetical protein
MNGSVQAINIVFDGPPAHDGGPFVESSPTTATA